MTGTTANGWPYVTPTDNPKSFPAHSQALANKIEADLRGFKVGITASPMNASGILSVTHGLGRVPTHVFMTPTSNTASATLALLGYRVGPFTATTFDIYCTRSDTSAAYANAAAYFFWIAI